MTNLINNLLLLSLASLLVFQIIRLENKLDAFKPEADSGTANGLQYQELEEVNAPSLLYN